MGTLPTTETVSGVITAPTSVHSVYSDFVGTLEKYCKKSGDEVKSGDKIAEIKLTDGTVKSIEAERDGVLSVLLRNKS